MNKSGNLGTLAETATVKFLKSVGWPDCERRRPNGQYDRGDITLHPKVVIEVKGGHAAEQASDGQVEAWLEEAQVECDNAGAELGFLVMKRKGISYGRAGEWWAVMRGYDYARLVLPAFDVAGATFHPVVTRPIRMRLCEAAQLLLLNGYTHREAA